MLPFERVTDLVPCFICLNVYLDPCCKQMICCLQLLVLAFRSRLSSLLLGLLDWVFPCKICPPPPPRCQSDVKSDLTNHQRKTSLQLHTSGCKSCFNRCQRLHKICPLSNLRGGSQVIRPFSYDFVVGCRSLPLHGLLGPQKLGILYGCAGRTKKPLTPASQFPRIFSLESMTARGLFCAVSGTLQATRLFGRIPKFTHF